MTKDRVLLDVQHVSSGYDKQTIFHNLSLQIQAGEIVGLLGPNGSGKTTLLRLLSGVLQPRDGRVLLARRDLRQWGRRDVARQIAVVPQELHLPFAFTVEHMVSLGRAPFVSSLFGSRTSDDHAIMYDSMVVAGVDTLAQRVFNELSGGEQQRVLIAMALAQQPSVLLLDEPTAHLDIKYQIEVLELVQRLHRERGVAVVAALHDLNLAARYFSRLVLFQRGIVADASPAEVLLPDLLARVYGTPVQVGILRGAEHLTVSSTVRSEDAAVAQSEKYPPIHVFSGGGSGALLMRALADAHLSFVAGALNIGDSDHMLALRLATTVITEQPYSPISDIVLAQVRASLNQVSMLVICPAPIGSGNFCLFEEAVLAARRGLSVILLAFPSFITEGTGVCATQETWSQEDIAARDYTGGAGRRAIEALIASGAEQISSIGEVIDRVRRFENV